MTRTTLLFSLVLLCSSSACRKKVAAPEAPTAAPAMAEMTQQQAISELKENFARVHFDFDSAALTEESKEALDDNAKILVRHKSLVVEIQGHADERGTIDYNIALGDRRAKTVRDRLQLQGVGIRQLRTVSMGEERPAVAGSGELVWSANRRAEFRILVGAGDVSGTTEI